MNLLDLMVDEPLLAPAAGFAPGALVRTRDGRQGRVVLYVEATERAFVRFQQLELAQPVHRLELEVVGPPCRHAHWDDSETVWPGENVWRLTRICRDCGEVRGRAA